MRWIPSSQVGSCQVGAWADFRKSLAHESTILGRLCKWWNDPINYDGVMVSVATQHEPSSKLLLNGLTTAANQPAEQDLKTALDDIFNHPNVGPFIGKQLIQHLVTSNPSPGYVARVAAEEVRTRRRWRRRSGAWRRAVDSG